MEGWIKLYRKLSEKGFYKKDSEKVHLWVHLMIRATHEGREEMLGGKPVFCKPGQFTTGRNQLEKETGINRSKIERILDYFEKIEQQIEQQKTTTNRLISINNWTEYQQCEQQIEQQASNDRATSEQQVSTLQECNNDKNDKNNILPRKPIKKKKEFTPPSLDEIKKYFTENEYSEELAIKFLKYYEAGNWTYVKDGKIVAVKNWKQKAQSSWFKFNPKTPKPTITPASKNEDDIFTEMRTKSLYR